MHFLSRHVGSNASCILLALVVSLGCGDSKHRPGDDGDAGAAGNGGSSGTGDSGAGGDESGGTSGDIGAGGETEIAGMGGEPATAGTSGTSGSGGTAGSGDSGGTAGTGGSQSIPHSAARLVSGGTVMQSGRFRLIGTMATGIAEGTSSASTDYELHGLATGSH